MRNRLRRAVSPPPTHYHCHWILRSINGKTLADEAIKKLWRVCQSFLLPVKLCLVDVVVQEAVVAKQLIVV